MLPKRKIGLFLGPALFLFILLFVHPEGMSPAARKTLAVAAWLAVWWMTEAVPIAMTSLLPIILFPLLDVSPIKEVVLPYSNKIIFLFIGGFIIALAMERWNLHKRIALSIIAKVGANARMIVLGFMLATGFLSMWISNTATTMMMLPIAMAIIAQFRQMTARQEDMAAAIDKKFGQALLLSIAFAASIGGMATLVGTPTNLIFSGFVLEYYGVDIPFAKWMLFGLPISLLLLIISWFHMTHWAFPLKNITIEGGQREIHKELKALGPISYEERAVLIVFTLVSLAWIGRSYIIKPFIPGIDDAIIALIGALLLFIIPAKQTPTPLMSWGRAVQLPWGILLLFGGAFSLAAAIDVSGLGAWLADQLSLFKGAPFLLILLVLVAVVNFTTELTQNMATCTLLMPVLAALTPVLNLHPYGLMIAGCIASSCAFMLPVATAPNAIMFGTGAIEMKDMIRAGVWLNLISIMLIVLFTYFLLPVLWDIDLRVFPSDMLGVE